MQLIHQHTGGRLPTSTYAMHDAGEEVGFLQLRHRPSCSPEVPAECASHIYYEVRQDRRGHGYGTRLFALGLEEAKRLGFSEIVASCLVSNVVSKRIIEKSGGLNEGSWPTTDNDRIYRYRFILT
jgi:predicted acetyltransferase